MTTEKKCVIAEQIGEVFIGATIATVMANNVFPKCNTIEKIAVTVGTGIGSWMIGRVWAKHWLKFCDHAFDTDFEDVIDGL